jgi:hypothetical protein
MLDCRALLALVATCAAAACGSKAPPPAPAPEPSPAPPPDASLAPPDAPADQAAAPQRFRWVDGLAATAVSTSPTAAVADQLGPAPSGCTSGDPRGHQLIADVAPAEGAETIVVALGHGVVVRAANGDTLATAPLACGGSADDLVAIAVGDAGTGTPVIAVVATVGGRREATTSVVLYGVVDRDGEVALERQLAAPIEVRDGERVATGDVAIVDGAIVHDRPRGPRTRWAFDAGRGRYVRR